MSDSRMFIKVDDDIENNPKAAALSDKAFRHLIYLWGYSHRKTTDGRIPLVIFSRVPAAARKELLRVGLAIQHQDHVEMHDYLDWQQSKKQIEDAKEAKRTAGSRGGKARARNIAAAKAGAKADAKQMPKQNEADIDIDIDVNSPTAVEGFKDGENSAADVTYLTRRFANAAQI